VAVLIDMQGKLEPVEIAGNFQSAMDRFEVASAKGIAFVALTKPDGKSVGLYVPNMLTFEEVDDEPGYLA
jgi:hypothetical protein